MIQCNKCGGPVTLKDLPNFGKLWTGITGHGFTTRFGPADVYLCEPCVIELAAMWKFMPVAMPDGDD